MPDQLTGAATQLRMIFDLSENWQRRIGRARCDAMLRQQQKILCPLRHGVGQAFIEGIDIAQAFPALQLHNPQLHGLLEQGIDLSLLGRGLRLQVQLNHQLNGAREVVCRNQRHHLCLKSSKVACRCRLLFCNQRDWRGQGDYLRRGTNLGRAAPIRVAQRQPERHAHQEAKTRMQ